MLVLLTVVLAFLMPASGQRPNCALYGPNTACNRHIDYVCGSDGFSYDNTCFFQIAQCANPKLYSHARKHCDDTRLTKEECARKAGCTREYIPLCGSDGRNFINTCFFQYAQCKNPNLTLHGSWECDNTPLTKEQCSRPRECFPKHDSVCGSDGVSYRNPCEFKFAQCDNPKLFRRDQRHCDDIPVRLTKEQCARKAGCTREYIPLCGSDGRNFINTCFFQYAQCKNPNLSLHGSWECDNTPLTKEQCSRPRECFPKHDIVCGSDGVSYRNPCEFKFAQCDNAKLFRRDQRHCDDIPVRPTKDECDRHDGTCTREYFPECGSDGKTYDNLCVFELAQCKNPNLTLQHHGQCVAT